MATELGGSVAAHGTVTGVSHWCDQSRKLAIVHLGGRFIPRARSTHVDDPPAPDDHPDDVSVPSPEFVVTADATDAAFDAIVIGAGQAGPGIARHLVSTGRTVALVEADKVGGTCLNRGCRPTKALRASARVAHLARTAERHGVRTGEVTVDFGAVMARKDALIDGWVTGLAESLGHTDGLTLLYGEARFAGRSESAFEILVGRRSLTAPEVFLNVGTRATTPPIPGLDDVVWLDNDSVLHLDQLPAHLLILGGSYIGLELGQLFRRFGSAVTVIEDGPKIAGREDPEITVEIARFLSAEGIEIRTSTTVERVASTDGGVCLNLAGGGTIDGSHLLVAIGRTPNTDRLDERSTAIRTRTCAVSSPQGLRSGRRDSNLRRRRRRLPAQQPRPRHGARLPGDALGHGLALPAARVHRSVRTRPTEHRQGEPPTCCCGRVGSPQPGSPERSSVWRSWPTTAGGKLVDLLDATAGARDAR